MTQEVLRGPEYVVLQEILHHGLREEQVEVREQIECPE